MISEKNEYMPPVMFHPGVILAEKLEEIKMPIKEFALRCQKPAKTIHDVLKGNSNITPDMSILFENVLKIPARFWMKLQGDYDEYLARQRRNDEIRRGEAWMRNFPFSDMVEKKLIPAPETNSTTEKIQILLEYFGIAKFEAWEAYYQGQTLCTAFRLSLAGMKNRFSLSAWLRHGEIEVTRKNIGGQFDSDKLKKHIPVMLKLANNYTPNFKEELVKLCEEAGIVLVYTPHIKNSKAQGATRWINSCPLVQISDCWKQYDIFWFSFFHELGHILLHNKKDIFLEGIEYKEKSPKKEEEANLFASEKLVPVKLVDELRSLVPYSETRLRAISKREKIHLAFLVGRMHHLKILDHAVGKKFIPPVSF
ncbi:HigA family addiction module antitoxin [uncultured Victivallis sp.]|uniref:HigA family addiction module antitoxin n=1 Tax=uncultured Victivallis sp. TaxID=354118 RepID=UPI002599BD93|nr:HigA family addiction module antitoxin [uncultured Victivallis sp.]